MTREQYVKEFSKALLVAKPQRNEIIAELETHFEEADEQAVSRSLGNPTATAKRYNSEYIGSIFGLPRLLLTLLVSYLFFFGFQLFSIVFPKILPSLNYLPASGVIMFFLQFVGPFLVAAYLGSRIGRHIHSRKLTLQITAVSILLHLYCGLIAYSIQGSQSLYGPTSLSGVLIENFWYSLMSNFFLLATVCATAVLYAIPSQSNVRLVRAQLALQSTVLLLVFLFWLVPFSMAMLAPIHSPLDLVLMAGALGITVGLGYRLVQSAWRLVQLDRTLKMHHDTKSIS